MARSAPAPAGHRGAPGLSAAGSALLPPEFLPRNFVPGGRRERALGAGRARPRPRPRCRARGARRAPPNAAPAAPGAPGMARRAPGTAPGGARRLGSAGVRGPAPRPPRLHPRARCPVHRLLCSSAEIALRQLLHTLAPLTPLWVPQNASCIVRPPGAPSLLLLSNSSSPHLRALQRGSPGISAPAAVCRGVRDPQLCSSADEERSVQIPSMESERWAAAHEYGLLAAVVLVE